jgi:hypothetical protein
MESKDIAILGVAGVIIFAVWKSGLLKLISTPVNFAASAAKDTSNVLGSLSNGATSVIGSVGSGLSGIIAAGSNNAVKAINLLGSVPDIAGQDITDVAKNVGQDISSGWTNAMNTINPVPWNGATGTISQTDLTIAANVNQPIWYSQPAANLTPDQSSMQQQLEYLTG